MPDAMNGRAPVGSGTSRSWNQSMPSAANEGSNHAVDVTRLTISPASFVMVAPWPLMAATAIPIRPSWAPHFCRMTSAIAMNMGNWNNVQLIWPRRLTFHLLSKADIVSFTSFFTVNLACLMVRKLPRFSISSRFWKASACRSGWRPIYRAMRARE